MATATTLRVPRQRGKRAAAGASPSGRVAGRPRAKVLMNDIAMRRYLRGTDLALLVAAAMLESVGYRQLNAVWGCLGTVQALGGKREWGRMKRRAFQV